MPRRITSLIPWSALGRSCAPRGVAVSVRWLGCGPAAAPCTPAAPTAEPLVDFIAGREKELLAALRELGYPGYRLRQINRYIYERNILDPALMLDIPLDLRQKLSERCTFGRMSVAEELVSRDGTVKRAYRLHDGQLIESVLMPYEDGRYTACVSSQAGCAMKCSFCATGQMGFARQLNQSEIFEQTLRFSTALRAQKKRLSNVVFMGMGEPMNNYNHVIKAVRRIVSDLGIGSRHITISTVGIAPRIKTLAHEENLQCRLAVSLHQTDNAARSALMPVNDKYSIEAVLEACAYYIEHTRRRVSFEWALISGVTDTDRAARDLGGLLKGMLCHVNLIPLNPTKGFAEQPSSREAANAFVKTLASFGVTATLRVRRGIDISAGCGQLTSELQRRAREEGPDGDGGS